MDMYDNRHNAVKSMRGFKAKRDLDKEPKFVQLPLKAFHVKKPQSVHPPPKKLKVIKRFNKNINEARKFIQVNLRIVNK